MPSFCEGRHILSSHVTPIGIFITAFLLILLTIYMIFINYKKINLQENFNKNLKLLTFIILFTSLIQSILLSTQLIVYQSYNNPSTLACSFLKIFVEINTCIFV